MRLRAIVPLISPPLKLFTTERIACTCDIFPLSLFFRSEKGRERERERERGRERGKNVKETVIIIADHVICLVPPNLRRLKVTCVTCVYVKETVYVLCVYSVLRVTRSLTVIIYTRSTRSCFTLTVYFNNFYVGDDIDD